MRHPERIELINSGLQLLLDNQNITSGAQSILGVTILDIVIYKAYHLILSENHTHFQTSANPVITKYTTWAAQSILDIS